MNRFTFREREPFGPLVAVSQRGVLHRAKAGPVTHKRCAGGRPQLMTTMTNAQAVEFARGRPSVLCRYPWCFRQAVRAAGLDPEVGHGARSVKRPSRRTRAPTAPLHIATPIRPHEVTPGWEWCACGDIIMRNVSARTSTVWWTHKRIRPQDRPA